jgi:hypothetical protein
MMTLNQVAVADLDTLTDELGAACWESNQTCVHEAREAVARLLCEYADSPFGLYDEDDRRISDATTDQVVESVQAGPEGWILVDGVRCYVR